MSVTIERLDCFRELVSLIFRNTFELDMPLSTKKKVKIENGSFINNFFILKVREIFKRNFWKKKIKKILF